MKYQVVCSGKVLSTHKSHALAERALKRWMKKHREERRRLRAHNELLRMVTSIEGETIKEIPVYTIRTIRP